jgi:3-oxoacyl-[acyl-carrier-protein] synthase-1
LVVGATLPASVGKLPFSPCTAAFGELPPTAGVPAFADTRQLRLGWAGLARLQPAIAKALSRFGATRVGLILGTSTGGLSDTETAFATLSATGTLPKDYSCLEGHAFDAAVRHLANKLGVRGPSYVVSTACSSAAKALASARRLINVGVCDAVVVGGVDTLCRMTLMGFRALGVLADERCRPFDGATSGMNVAEGAAWLLLDVEPADVYLLGSGESSDAHHMVAPDPEGQGARRAIEAALDDAAVTADRVGYVNAHGTGTDANDNVERAVLDQILPKCPASSTKALHGHQLGASGATEAAVCIEVLRGSALPLVETPPSATPPNVVMSNSLAFGGSNVSLVFGRTAPRRERQAAAFPMALGIDSVAVWCEAFPTFASLARPGGAAPSLPAAALLPTRQRGRADLLTRLFAEVIEQLAPAETLRRLPFVYGSALGPVQTTLDLLAQQANGECSPLRFQNSVHNAAAGALSIALGNREFSTSVAGGKQTVAIALLEAAAWLASHPEHAQIVVVVGDEHPPKPLLSDVYAPLAVAFLLSRSPGNLGQLRLGLEDRPGLEDHPGDRIPTELPALLRQNPCAASLDLAWAVSRKLAGRVDLCLERSAGVPACPVRLSFTPRRRAS